MHHGKTIDPDSGAARKPEIVTFYNCTKGGVDVVDEMCVTYSTARKTNRWPLSAFFHLLDVVGVNSFGISSYNEKGDQRLMRKTWLKELAKELVSPYMRSRLLLPKRSKPNKIQEKGRHVNYVRELVTNLITLVRFAKYTSVEIMANLHA
ncbi:unnamed protein product [Acanthoscelides obtectus]|uniref:PiggyBac transposable element-derived protein domain-containing protein n=1 Tax=Acanthoscelides obtectus TaxID=200917 RepID=A0A9P0PJM3_ACAOB|nr:unnamed protein product [Acanthoscelides obtectus]CAK1620435.1 hypothetical protein AOBTE_LOCUS373 [Acanthoscelides obtectus]